MAFHAFVDSDRQRQKLPARPAFVSSSRIGYCTYPRGSLNVALRRAEEACEGGREQLFGFYGDLLEAVGSTCKYVLVLYASFDVVILQGPLPAKRIKR